MKRSLAWGAMLAAAFVLCACSGSGMGNMGRTLGNWAAPAPNTDTLKPIDIEAYQNSDFSATLGIDVVSLPNAEEVTANKFFALDGWFGQIEFTTADGLSLNVRLAKGEERGLSSTYGETHTLERHIQEFDGIEVTVASAQRGCALMSWERGGVQYAMHSNAKQGVPPTEDIERMVLGLDSIITDDTASES